MPIDDVLRGDCLIFIDGGARGGLHDCTALAPYATVLGFEPNPAEVKKLGPAATTIRPLELRRGTTTAYPYAICGTSGSVTLNVTLRPGATSTLQPDPDLAVRFAADHWSEMCEVVETIEVPSISLAEFARASATPYCDFLKLDTQGNEYEILDSAGEFLDRVGVIKTEVELYPLYKGQRLFHDVVRLLAARGFDLVDLTWTEPCRRFHARPDLPPRAYRLVWGDAIFVRRPYEFSDPRGVQKALVLAHLGYVDLAIYLFRNAKDLSAKVRAELEQYAVDLLAPQTTKGKIRAMLERWFSLQITRYDWKRGQQVKSARRR